MLSYGNESCKVRITDDSRFASGKLCSLRKTAQYIVKERKKLWEEFKFQKQEIYENIKKKLERENRQSELWQDSKERN
jgi:hypothetical protein